MKKILIFVIVTIMLFSGLSTLLAASVSHSSGGSTLSPMALPSSATTTAYANGTFTGFINENTYTSGSTVISASKSSTITKIEYQDSSMDGTTTGYVSSYSIASQQYYAPQTVSLSSIEAPVGMGAKTILSSTAYYYNFASIDAKLVLGTNTYYWNESSTYFWAPNAGDTNYYVDFNPSFAVATAYSGSATLAITISPSNTYGGWTSSPVAGTLATTSPVSFTTGTQQSSNNPIIYAYPWDYSAVTASTGAISQPSGIQAAQFSYSSPYALEATGGSQTSSQATSNTLTYGSSPPSSSTFQDVSGDPNVASFTVSWSTPNVVAASSQAASFSSSYTITQSGNWFNGTPSFTFTPPSGWINGGTVDGATWDTSFSYSVNNLYVTGYGSPYDQFSISGHKSISAFTPSSQHYSFSDSATVDSSLGVSYTAHDAVNYNPSISSISTSFSGSGSTAVLKFTTSEQITGEKETIQINWGDGSSNSFSSVAPGALSYSHTYGSLGTFSISITATNEPSSGITAESASGSSQYTMSIQGSPYPQQYSSLSGTQTLYWNYSYSGWSPSSAYVDVNGLPYSANFTQGSLNYTGSFNSPSVIEWHISGGSVSYSATYQYSSSLYPSTDSQTITALFGNNATSSYPITLSGAPTDYSYPISITTSAPNASLSYQQELIIQTPANYHINSAGSNIQFKFLNQTAIYAWEQSVNSSQLVVYLKLFQDINQSILMDVYALGDNFFSATGTLGEAPQLSPSYAEYDNGWRVFLDYENFQNWSGFYTFGNQYFSESKGLYFNGGSGTLGAVLFNSTYSRPVTVDAYMNSTGGTGGYVVGTAFFSAPTSPNNGYGWFLSTSITTIQNLTAGSISRVAQGSAITASQASTLSVYSMQLGPSNISTYINGTLILYGDNTTWTTEHPGALAWYGNDYNFYQWMRVRAYVPSMPTTSIGSPTTFAYSGDHYYQEINVSTAGKGINSYGNNVMIGSSSRLYNTTVIHSGSTTQLQAYLPFSADGTLNEFLYVYPYFEGLTLNGTENPYETQATYTILSESVFQANATNTTPIHFLTSNPDPSNTALRYYNYWIADQYSMPYLTLDYNASWSLFSCSAPYRNYADLNFITMQHLSGIGTIQITFLEPAQIANPYGEMGFVFRSNTPTGSYLGLQIPFDQLQTKVNGAPQYTNPMQYVIGNTYDIQVFDAFGTQIYEKNVTPTAPTYTLVANLTFSTISFTNQNSTEKVHVSIEKNNYTYTGIEDIMPGATVGPLYLPDGSYNLTYSYLNISTNDPMGADYAFTKNLSGVAGFYIAGTTLLYLSHQINTTQSNLSSLVTTFSFNVFDANGSLKNVVLNFESNVNLTNDTVNTLKDYFSSNSSFKNTTIYSYLEDVLVNATFIKSTLKYFNLTALTQIGLVKSAVSSLNLTSLQVLYENGDLIQKQQVQYTLLSSLANYMQTQGTGILPPKEQAYVSHLAAITDPFQTAQGTTYENYSGTSDTLWFANPSNSTYSPFAVNSPAYLALSANSTPANAYYVNLSYYYENGTLDSYRNYTGLAGPFQQIPLDTGKLSAGEYFRASTNLTVGKTVSAAMPWSGVVSFSWTKKADGTYYYKATIPGMKGSFGFVKPSTLNGTLVNASYVTQTELIGFPTSLNVNLHSLQIENLASQVYLSAGANYIASGQGVQFSLNTMQEETYYLTFNTQSNTTVGSAVSISLNVPTKSSLNGLPVYEATALWINNGSAGTYNLILKAYNGVLVANATVLVNGNLVPSSDISIVGSQIQVSNQKISAGETVSINVYYSISTPVKQVSLLFVPLIKQLPFFTPYFLFLVVLFVFLAVILYNDYINRRGSPRSAKYRKVFAGLVGIWLSLFLVWIIGFLIYINTGAL